MTDLQGDLARFLAREQALFFRSGLVLKDGRPTPYFVNLGAIRTGRSGLELARFFARALIERDIIRPGDVIIGPSYKGPPLAALTAAVLYSEHGLEAAYDYDRKEAKTHGEAAGGKNMFVTGALAQGKTGVIIDDVATSMATKVELLERIKPVAPEFKVKAVIIAVDREQTQPVYDADGQVVLGAKGRDAVADFTAAAGVAVEAVGGVRAMVTSLYESGFPVLQEGELKPLTEETMAAFKEYLATYGR